MLETTTYELKTYSPDFFEEEVELTKEFEERKQLDGLYQTFRDESQVDALKIFREGGNPNFPFIPTDHWYLFDKDEGLVGHIYAYPQKDTKRCNISIIVTKEGHDKGAGILFDTLVNSVKDRGYDTLVRNTTEDHNTELEFLNQFGFEKTRLRNLRSRVSISELKIKKNEKYEIRDYVEADHREKIITDLYLPKGYQRQQLDTQFDTMLKGLEGGTVPSWVVALENGEVVGQSIAFYARPNIKYLAQFNTVTTNIDGDASVPLINAIYGSHLEKLSENITHIEHYLFNQVANLRPIYEKIGFKYVENHLYERPI